MSPVVNQKLSVCIAEVRFPGSVAHKTVSILSLPGLRIRMCDGYIPKAKRELNIQQKKKKLSYFQIVETVKQIILPIYGKHFQENFQT